MKRIIPFVIISFICSLIVLFININQISSGDEMGAIGEVFISLFYGIIIFVVTILISILSKNLFKKNQFYIQFVIHLVCVYLIYYVSYNICVYREPHLQPQEMKALRLEQIENTKEEVDKILSKAETYKPNKLIINNDKQQIKKVIKNFFNKSYHDIKSDSAYKDSLYNLLEVNISASDSIETDLFFKTIYESIDIDLILYSPDFSIILVFISFNETYSIEQGKTESGGSAFVLIGKKNNQAIKLYRFFYDNYSLVSNPNKESAFYQQLFYLTNNDRFNSRIFPIDKKVFWESEYIFGKEKIDEEIFHGFQLIKHSSCVGGNTREFINGTDEKHQIRSPLFIIQK